MVSESNNEEQESRLHSTTIEEITGSNEGYIIVDEVNKLTEIKGSIKHNKEEIKNLWKYLDVLLDMTSEDGKNIKKKSRVILSPPV